MNLFRISVKEALFGEGEVSYRHNSKINSSSAFELKEKAKIVIKLPRALGSKKVRVDFYSDEVLGGFLSDYAEFYGLCDDNDVYIIGFKPDDFGVGLYFYNIAVESVVGEVYSNKTSGNKFTLSHSKGAPHQITLSNFKYNPPQKYYGGIIYHIFVDRFYKSDKSRGLDKTGVGLGLFISKTIIEAHGEEIKVNSDLGKYCEFSFTLKKA